MQLVAIEKLPTPNFTIELVRTVIHVTCMYSSDQQFLCVGVFFLFLKFLWINKIKIPAYDNFTFILQISWFFIQISLNHVKTLFMLHCSYYHSSKCIKYVILFLIENRHDASEIFRFFAFLIFLMFQIIDKKMSKSEPNFECQLKIFETWISSCPIFVLFKQAYG